MTLRRISFAKTAVRGCLLALFWVGFVGWAAAQTASAPVPQPAAKVKPAPASMPWAESLDAALKKARATKKKVLVAVYAPWCGWCKVMHTKTFTDPRVIQLVSCHFVPVMLNAETRDSVSFMGLRYGYLPDQGMNELAYQLLTGRRSYPTTVFLSTQAEVLSPVRGYLNPEAFMQLISYFGEDAYLYTDWKQWEKTHPLGAGVPRADAAAVSDSTRH